MTIGMGRGCGSRRDATAGAAPRTARGGRVRPCSWRCRRYEKTLHAERTTRKPGLCSETNNVVITGDPAVVDGVAMRTREADLGALEGSRRWRRSKM